jgi:hypothetical protein
MFASLHEMRFNSRASRRIVFFLASAVTLLLLLSACSGQSASSSTGSGAGSSSTSGGSTTGGAVSFSADVLPIFQSRCASCHGSGRVSGGLNLTSFTSLMAGSQHGADVVPGDPNASRLVQMVVQGKMPKRGPALLTSQIQTISDWVKAGAANN